ncbi:MAG TPA: serine/threonine-protein kinase, partial [Gemmatimonadaceae bacterium]|nr:serine/threonine-protein kinase [Gemmatimonadaceae bacterium]
MIIPRPIPEFLALQRALIGRFSLVRELGRGGMGIVFLARDVSLDRNVAIKLLPPQLAALPNYRQRFLREARLAAALSHPHIVPIHLVDEVDDLVFFVMGFIDGETLGERVRRRGPLPPDEVARIVQQVAWGLAHAHARGVVHRDVKPDNILIERESGRAVVTDFGIAGAGGSTTPAEGVPLGTPLYLSPEQAAGSIGDARSDLFALGVTAWFALTGAHPHPESPLPALLVRKSTTAAPSIRTARTGLVPALADAIDRALALRPEDRWPDAESLARALEAGGARRSVPPRVRAFVRV